MKTKSLKKGVFLLLFIFAAQTSWARHYVKNLVINDLGKGCKIYSGEIWDDMETPNPKDDEFVTTFTTSVGCARPGSESSEAGSDSQIEALSDVVLFPNPANKVINLKIGKEKQFSKAELIGLDGKIHILSTGKELSGDVKLELKSITNGLYTLKLTKANNSDFVVKKIMINQ